jgi:hypothetical protein
MVMKKLPTDLEILEEIYNSYYSTFSSFSKEAPNRFTKVYVPIDVEYIARHFTVDPDIIFGRLYYHLDNKYSFTEPDGIKVQFFLRQAGSDKDSVQFPLLASVLAGLKEEQNKNRVSTWLSVTAIVISIVSLVFSLVFNH